MVLWACDGLAILSGRRAVIAEQILSTKLRIPHLGPTLVPRPHLVERLRAGLKCKLTLVSAPAGFGKTTLLVEGLSVNKLPIGWVSLDEGDNDPAQFWAYFVAAIRSTMPGVGENAQRLLQSAQESPVRTVLVTLINEITEETHSAVHPKVLVLDDYNVISEQSIHKDLGFFIDRLPPQFHLVIATRADPPLPLARLRAQGQLSEFRADEMRFSIEETATLMNRVMGLGLSDKDIATLNARTEGWVASLQMAAISMQGRPDITGFVADFGGTHRYILDFFMEEVLARHSASTQSFLLETSILDRLTASLCNAVTGREDSPEMLAWLESANLFIVPLDQDRQWYRYHQFFVELLRHRLSSSRSDALPALHRLASQWFEGEGLIPEAVHHALAAEDFDRAAGLIERVAMSMIAEGKGTTLMSWLARLPGDLVVNRPWLCVWGAWANLLAGRVDAVKPLAESAEATLTEADLGSQTDRLRGHSLALKAFLARARGDLEQSIELIHEAMELIPEDERVVRNILLLNLAGVYFTSGNMVAAVDLAKNAIIRARETIPLYDDILAINFMAYIEKQRGRLRQAAKLYREAIRLGTPRPGAHPLPVVDRAYVGLGQIFYEWDDLDEAERLLNVGIELGNEAGEGVNSVGGYLALARLKQTQGDRRGALEAIKRAEEVAIPMVSWLVPLPDYVRAWQAVMSLAQGDLEDAGRWADSPDLGLSLHDVPDFVLELPHLALVRVRIAQGRNGEIIEYLERLRHKAEKEERMGAVVEILLLESLSLQAENKIDRALDSLARALSLAEPEGYKRTFIDEGQPMARLLRTALSRGTMPRYVGELLAGLEGEGISALPPTVESLTEGNDQEAPVQHIWQAGRQEPHSGAVPRQRTGPVLTPVTGVDTTHLISLAPDPRGLLLISQ
jgi:LuxR family maltose regulon positive regulatory protein